MHNARDVMYEPDDDLEPTEQTQGERHALVIGIDRYQDPDIRDLQYAAADARAVHDILIDPQLGRFTPDKVTFLLDEEATERRIREVLSHELPLRAGSADTVFIYFAGHGAPVVGLGGSSRDGMEKYLVPFDAKLERLRASGIPMEDVQKWFGWMGAKQVLLFLDCCYSGAAEGRTVADLRATPRAPLTDEFLDKLSGEGRIVVTACDVNEVSLETPDLSHGIFTHYLVEGLRGAADRDQDGLVTIDELYDYVHEHVERRARELSGKMTPVKKGSVRGRIYLTRYETTAQKEAKELRVQAMEASERGVDDEAERLWRRVLDLVPGDAKATNGLAAIDEARRQERAQRERMRDVLTSSWESEAIPLNVFNYTMVLLERQASELDKKDALLLRLLGELAEGSLDVAVFRRTVERRLKPQTKIELKPTEEAETKQKRETEAATEVSRANEVQALAEAEHDQEALAADVGPVVTRTYFVRDVVMPPDRRPAWFRPAAIALVGITVGLISWRVFRTGGPGDAATPKAYLSASLRVTPAPPPEADDPLNQPVWIEGGTFQMGSADGDPGELPVHQVTISGFWIQEHEVTNEEYLRYYPAHEFARGQERYPVAGVTWQQAQEYAARRGGDLPTEAQWEFAARGSLGRKYPWGDDAPTCERAQYRVCSPPGAIPVMSRPDGATPEGVHDLAGNVSEWVRDWYGAYSSEAVVDPTGPASDDTGLGFHRMRGGNFRMEADGLRGSSRLSGFPDESFDIYGFRVVWSRGQD